MEEIQQHRGSRKGYRAHLTRLIANADEVMNTDNSNLTEKSTIKTATTLQSLIHQLNRKEKLMLISDLDAKILPLINDEDDIKTEVYETEEVQCKIAEAVGNINTFISTRLQHSTQQPTQSEQPRSKLPDTQPTPVSNTLGTGSTEHSTVTLENSTLPPSTLSDNSSTSTRSVAALHPPRDNLVPPSDSGATSSEQGIAVHLPKLTIPTFGEDALDWQPFWDSFETAIHNNSQLNGAQKLTYLRAQLRGDAAQVIAGLPLTSPSYQHSIEVLKKRFGEIALWPIHTYRH